MLEFFTYKFPRKTFRIAERKNKWLIYTLTNDDNSKLCALALELELIFDHTDITISLIIWSSYYLMESQMVWTCEEKVR